jgi:Zn-dependent protease
VGRVTAAGAIPLDDPELHPDSVASQLVRQELDKPATGAGLWLVLSLVLFLLSQVGSGLDEIIVITAVILFHEGGHYLAMRLFGYRDTRIFFVPFFGAMASGKRAGVEAWKAAVVSLAGPVPGVVLGCALAFAWPVPSGRAKTAIVTLLVINAFNLLPLGGLDGGQLFRRILFSRHRYLEVAFQAIAGIALLLLAIRLKSWALGIFAYLGIITVPYRARLLSAASRLRAELAGVTDAKSLEGAQWSLVFGAAREAARNRNRPAAPAVVARTMEALLEAIKPAPSVLATLALCAAWVVAAVVAVAGTVVVVAHAPPSYWHAQPLGNSGLSVEMPYRPKSSAPVSLVDAEGVAHLESGSTHWFAASVWTTEPGFIRLVDPPGVVERAPVSSGALAGEELRYVNPGGRVCKRRVLLSDSLLVLLDTCAPTLEPEMDRFLGSLRESSP